jgi:ribosome-binding protein aMBF1 (putative translation factor)
MSKTQKSAGQRSPSRKTRRTSNALEIIDRTIVGDDAGLREMIEQQTVNALVAQAIYDARTSAGLTQKQLAELIDTKQPVISQLEDADYEGHSLSMLKRIATALDCRLEIRIFPNPREPQHA